MSHELHLQLVAAVLGGEGLTRVAQLVSAAVRAPVAILVPRIAVAAAFPATIELGALRRYTRERVEGRATHRPQELVAEAPVLAGTDLIGVVALLRGEQPPPAEAQELLQLAAVASLTEVGIEDAKREVEQELRGTLLEELRTPGEQLDARQVVRRAARLGCDVSRGAVALCAGAVGADRRDLDALVAAIAAQQPGALAQTVDGRVFAIVPPPADEDGDGDLAARTLSSARLLARSLSPRAVCGLSSFCADPAALPRAIQEAELVLDVLRRSGGAVAEDVGQGTYRLLFRVLASHPEELRAFYDETVGPLVRYDERHASELVRTVETYLAQDCNVNATAAAIGAHRHTVAHRLERVKELTKLDPLRSEDRERLGLGLKALRIIVPERSGR
ncbi:helix-turn-helix domain-containing protein [Conexibacter sp. JD483]|uniref:PucR family transcriptional regulator n=1 Tax=unclassified Conexibacter TaxID=2627773 RepID=UPI002715E66A|nr:MULTISPECIES: helix-turn-helix domain-containing protein [unclassified Conexibacter]MDO8186170.1 helix-turn-helix domain-containing protein [Conexibacter sp. CPCC 205706]MDO8199660.1 helix-turn-helix domain-containing protein [Conexibacter sp. CPCC 205762]MDR9371790.1 helix-turn-helix domain-containing protein [Conexibacter sp. JD483]